MPRLIDADALEKSIKETYCTGCNNYNGLRCRACWVDDALISIDSAPTIEAENTELLEKIKQLEAERDALLKYLTNSHFVPCDICKHDKGDIMACERVRKVHGPCFEWCGLPGDAGGDRQ